MISLFDFWKVLAGVAIFMLGMMMLEEALQLLAGRPFKLFLRKHTTHKLKAIGAGAVVTAVLQSSSIVNLMLLAFVGSGIIQMENGLAMMLGSNIGTTFTSWIVATVGFEFNLENLALPATGIAGIAMMLLNKHSKWFQLSKFFLGFSFLFVGLNFMKNAVESMVQQTDLSRFNDYSVLLFLLIGVLITALIQASSTTIALVLAALHAHAIELQPAMAIVLGAEIGTTIKLFIASAKGIAAKKRVALGNFLMNVLDSLVLIFGGKRSPLKRVWTWVPSRAPALVDASPAPTWKMPRLEVAALVPVWPPRLRSWHTTPPPSRSWTVSSSTAPN